MLRRIVGFVALTGAVLLVAAPVSPAQGQAPSPTTQAPGEPQSPPPNIVTIMADDLTMQQYNDFMPQTKALIGDEGVTFDNFFVSYPECCPSRATFLTGQYSHNHGVESGNLPTGGYTKLDHSNTLPVWLQESGYTTGHVGKYLNDYGVEAPPQVPPGWDDFFGLVDTKPSALFWWDYDVYDNGQVVHYGTAPEDHQTTVLENQALDFIDNAAGADQPFFLNFDPGAPHVGYDNKAAFDNRPTEGEVDNLADVPPDIGWTAAPEYQGRLDGEPLPTSPNFDEQDLSDKPAFRQEEKTVTDADREALQSFWDQSGEMVLQLDDVVAAIVDRLDQKGVLDNTVIVFTSDNGVFWGEHGLGFSKDDPYEEAIHMPLLIRGPGFPSGVVESRPTINVDLAPTLAAIGRTEPGLDVDGLDLTSLLADETLAPDRAVLVESGPLLNRRYYHAIRTPTYIYIEYTTGEKEMYDLEADPYELDNIVDTPDVAALQSQLAARLAYLETCSGSKCSAVSSSGANPPKAISNKRLEVASGKSISLNGKQSSDPDGDLLVYEWKQLAGPDAGILDPTKASTVAAAPKGPAELTFELSVTDPAGNTATDQVDVTVLAPGEAPSEQAAPPTDPESGGGGGFPVLPFVVLFLLAIGVTTAIVVARSRRSPLPVGNEEDG